MFIKNKSVILALLVYATSTSITYADDTVWNFSTRSADFSAQSSVNEFGSQDYFGNQLAIDNDNDGTPELTIQAWADTGCGWNCGNDSHVEQGYVATNSFGLLNYNLDAPNNRRLTGEEHLIDNIDDVDMLLFSFSENVALTGIDLGYVDSDSDISIAAFNQLPSLSGSTWSEIVDTAAYSASFSDIGTSPYTLVNEISNVIVEAQYWLIGAYNSTFGDLGADSDYYSDSFKLASITTEVSTPSSKPPTEVTEPSTVAMLASFGLFIMWRRKKTA